MLLMYLPYYLLSLERVNRCVGILWIPSQPLQICKKAQEDHSGDDCFQFDADVEVEDVMRKFPQERGSFSCILVSRAILCVEDRCSKEIMDRFVIYTVP